MGAPLHDEVAASGDAFDLQRFVAAQADTYARALAEIRGGGKRSHWMWFIFPQYVGLGRSATAEKYAIRSLAEAAAYWRHPVLGPRLAECAGAVLDLEGRSMRAVFGFPDNLKLQSCATLFERVAPAGSVCGRVLDMHYAGQRDAQTLRLIAADQDPAHRA
jgi:uncharacterized protein (DUF1810 family)